MTIHTAALMGVSCFNSLKRQNKSATLHEFDSRGVEILLHQVAFCEESANTCIKLQPSTNWMLPGSTSLAALKRIMIWLWLTASSLVLLAHYPQQRGKPKCCWKKKKNSLSLAQAHGPVGTGFSDLFFFLMSLKLIFSHNCISFEGITKDFV